MSHPCLIDSHTGQSFTKTELQTTVDAWVARIRAAIPDFFGTPETLEQQRTAGHGGWYTYVTLDKSAAVVVACLATEAMCGSYVLSDFDDRQSIIDRVRPVAAFVSVESVNATPSDNVYRIVVDIDQTTITDILPPTTRLLPERAVDADVKYITFSSGSTGRPKGIYGSHFCVDFMNQARHKLFPYRQLPNDKPWTIAVNIFVLWEAFRPIVLGEGCAVIVRQEAFVDPDRFLDIIKRYEVNEILLTSSYAKLFLAHQLLKKVDLASGHKICAPPSLLRVWQNGEPVTESLREAFVEYCTNPECELINLYSISECYEVGYGDLRKSNTALQTFPNVRIECDPDNKSEVIVHTPSIRHGYHKPSTESEARAFASDGLSFYRTGDCGEITSQPGEEPQHFKLTGRCSKFIRVKGRFVSLEQVEDVVERGLGLAGRGLATVEVDPETRELIAYVDGGFESERLPQVRALCPFPEWMPDRFVRHAPNVRRPSPSGKTAPGQFNATAARADAIRQVLLQHVGVDVHGLHHAMSLRDLGISSLSILRLKEALKTQAGVDMSVGDLYKISDVRKFVAETVTPDMLNEEVSLIVSSVLNVPAFKPEDDAAPHEPSAYFITGATGFLGGWVLDAVAKRDPNAEIYLLSRRSAEETLAVIEKKGLTISSRTKVIVGDTSKPGFGMEIDDVRRLQREVRFYIHCAAHVVFGCSYAEARPSTVMGANNLLTLYLGSHPSAELHYVSTNGIFPPHFTHTTNRACLESLDDFDLYAARLKEGYGWSKWVAEKSVVDVCRQRERRLRVYRPGNIGWSNDGRVNPLDFQTLIIFACRALGCVPDVPTWNFELTPVDELASFMAGNCGVAPPSGLIGTHNVIGKRTPVDFFLDAKLPRRPMSEWLAVASEYAANPPANATARDKDAVEQTRASFEEYVTLDMYLSDTNDYYTENSFMFVPTADYARAV